MDVELIRENADGSADYMFNFPPEAMAALTRLGIMTALRAGLDEAKYLDPNVDASDTSPERDDKTVKQRHEWVGLTIEEVKTIVDSATSDNGGYDIFTDGTQVAFLVEAKLKEKNNENI